MGRAARGRLGSAGSCGAPFHRDLGIQHLKLAPIALTPIGLQVVPVRR